MSDVLPLHQLVTVNGRFARSVSLVRDFESPGALDGYILTPIGRDVLNRIQASLSGESSARAWSLTGAYGSGKSAFALFVSQLLAGELKPREKARQFLRERDAEISAGLFDRGGAFAKKSKRLFPVLVTGSRQPLDKAFASSLAQAVRSVWSGGRPPKIIEKLDRFAASNESSTGSVAALFEEADEYLKRSEEFIGILLIVDELGKFLEYGASHPDRGDVFVLQEIAEAAARSKRPFLVLTILHQALDRYADHMSPSRRSEWAKVQGRFEDVAFEERTEQLVRLLSEAIWVEGTESARKPLLKQSKRLATQVAATGVRVGSLGGGELADVLASCFPLHPLTALIVGPLFRQLAQNERSLFAFLVSSETFGFQEFLRTSDVGAKGCPTYRLDLLYDYLVSSLGPSLYIHHRGKTWAEVEAALERLRDAPGLEIQLAKIIGLLQAIGPLCPVSPSQAVLELALQDVADEKEIAEGLNSLLKKSVAIFRKHQSAYALWEGSDIEIEARLQEARRQVERDQPMAAFLMLTLPPQAMIARRHYFQKGTLRYFGVCYADRSTLELELVRDLEQADGRIIFCLPMNSEERQSMEAILKSQKVGISPSIVAAIPNDVLDLGEYCHELLCLRWVLENTPELESDRTAYKELHGRLTHAEQNLRKHLEWVFTPQVSREAGCLWFVEGKHEVLSSLRAVNDLLSRVCDGVYPHTPTWRNELINRRSLSSAAAAARRNLIQAMIEHATEEKLGFDGVPPERCMYETLLHSSRLHRKQGEAWGFFPPDAKSEESLKEIWKAIDRFLTDSEPGRLPLGRLFDVLRKSPFGLKDGVLPVIFATALLYFDTEVALYEDGTFVPRLNDAIFERMFRSPEPYAVQRFRIAGPRYDIFRRYAALLNRAEDAKNGSSPDLLTLVKPLVRLVRDLPEYVFKTKKHSATAQAVLKSIREARQPDQMLFVDIPKACGFPAFEADSEFPESQVGLFFDVLRSSLAELQRSYPDLIASVEQVILEAFDKRGNLSDARREMEHEARLIMHLAVDTKLKAFLMRAVDLDSDDSMWVETIANLLVSKAPSVWDDQDRARFEVQLTATARTFRHFRVLAFEMERKGDTLLDGDPQMLRVSVTLPFEGDFERVVQVPPQYRSQAKLVQDEVRRVLSNENFLNEREVSVAVLAQLVQQLLVDKDPAATSPKKRSRS